MPRSPYYTEPKVINTVQKSTGQTPHKYLEIATGNRKKLEEFQRILKDYQIIGKDLEVDEIQSLDPMKVVGKKAKEAYRLNGYNPILVEDTSLELKGLGSRPGTYVKDFMEDPEMRRVIASEWLKGRNRSALARVTLALYDGVEVHIWKGEIEGSIAEEPKGMNGFTWDDIFIPKGESRTFAEMTDEEKDSYSMRVKAIQAFVKKPYDINYPIFELPEPYEQELQRVQIDKLTDKKAIQFAYKLESLEENNKPSKDLIAPNYENITFESNSYFSRYFPKPKSKSLGLMLTDVDRGKLKLYKNGDPVLWQMGPERRHLALAQRVEYFMQNQDPEVHKILDDLELKKAQFPNRTNRRSTTIEQALRIQGYETVTQALSLKEIGYKKLSSLKNVSRTKSSKFGLFNVIGKHARSMYAVGSLPFTSGWRDVIVMSALGHMLVFVHRNNINAINFQNQIDLINDAKKTITDLKLGRKATERAFNNIGAALGCNPVEDLAKAKRLYKEAGVKAFRIYTINSDPRVIQTAKAIRDELGDEVEIFVGQLVDKKQCQALIAPDIRVDGFIFGHGGGRQCTSATNGMALATLEEMYQIVTDHQFNNTSILVEGGLSTYVGAMMIMGVDCILRNAQFTNCVIEQGDIYFEDNHGEIVQPYHGSASAATMIIESYNKENAEQRLFFSGRTKNVEGKSGYIYYKERANSMAFYIDEFKHYAARTLADLGVESIWELREFLNTNHEELFRLMTPESIHTGTAYRS